MARKYGSIFEVEESLFGDFRVTHRFNLEDGTEQSDTYHNVSSEELAQLLTDLQTADELHLIR